MNSITTIIDGDTLVYFLAYRLQNKEVEEAVVEIDTYIELILNNTNCTHYLGFLGESKTFRHELYPLYKANRPEKPEWLGKWDYFIKGRLVDKWKFILSGVLEAEDCAVICIEYYKNQTNCIYAHIDKDGNSIEGNHYDYSKHTLWYTDKLGSLDLRIKREGTKNQTKKLYGTGLKWLYAQYLLGDKGDNIPNCRKGCGDVYVYNLLNSCITELQLMNKVYQEFLKHSSREAFVRNRTLVKMLDKPAYDFVIPKEIEYKKEEINIFEL